MRHLAIGRTSIAALGALALAGLLGGASPRHTPPASPPAEYTIVASDYAFQLPGNIRAGSAAFAFENRGAVYHEVTIARLRRGVTTDSAAWAVTHGVSRRELVDGQAALLIGAPSDPPGPKLLLELERGRTYLVSCVLRDAPGKPQHVMLGMFTTFTPQ